jgi:hypothetical protein
MHIAELRTSDIVNLGFVLNVIEDERERRQAARRAYDLRRREWLARSRDELENHSAVLQSRPCSVRQLSAHCLKIRVESAKHLVFVWCPHPKSERLSVRRIWSQLRRLISPGGSMSKRKIYSLCEIGSGCCSVIWRATP